MSLLPGTLAAAVLTAAIWLAQGYLPSVLGPTLVALAGGLALGTLVSLPPGWRPGLTFSSRSLLKLAIALTGVRLSLADVRAVGGGTLLLILLAAGASLLVSRLVARGLGLAPRLGTLVGLGAAICGNSAIVAAAPLVGAREEEVGAAVATTTLAGTLAVFVYPLVGAALDLAPGRFGLWTGVAINDTAQVLAAGFAYGEAAGTAATVVKLTRNLLILPALLALSVTHFGRTGARWSTAVPWFVIGFLVLVIAANQGWIPAAAAAWLSALARFLLLMALGAIGLTTDLKALARVGLRSLLASPTIAMIMGTFTLLLLAVL